MRNINLNEGTSQTQCECILDYMKKGGRISSLVALKKFGFMRLSARILDLKNRGYNIADEMIKDKSSGKHYKCYWLVGGHNG